MGVRRKIHFEIVAHKRSAFLLPSLNIHQLFVMQFHALSHASGQTYTIMQGIFLSVFQVFVEQLTKEPGCVQSFDHMSWH